MKNVNLLGLCIILFLYTDFIHKVYAADGMLPKTTGANQVYVFDCRSDVPTARMIAMALQGLINSDSAEVYLLQTNHHKGQLIESGKSHTEVSLTNGFDPGLRTLFRQYMNRVQKMIIFDTAKDWTWNIALMKAAQENGLPVTEYYKDKLISEFGWIGSIEDVRVNWTNRSDAYMWAISNLMPGCKTDQVIFSLGLRDDWINAPWLLYDYAIATKGFIFWLDESKMNEKDRLIDICKAGDYSAGSVVMGYAESADDLLKVVNEFGIGYVVSDYYANGSFWASFPNRTFFQQNGNAVAVENGKIYVSIIWSDGDNIQFDQNALYLLWKDDPARGSIPVGSTMGAALQEINSPLLNWYYANITYNDELLAGPSGYQFIYVRNYGSTHYPTWLELNNRWLADAGFHTACVWHTSFRNERLIKYANTAGLEAIFVGDNDLPKPFIVDNVAVLNQGNSLWNKGDLYTTLNRIQPDPVRPIFMNVYPIAAFYGFDNSAPVGFTRLQNEIAKLNDKFPGRFVFLLPKDLAATMREYYSSDITSADFDTRGNPEEALYLFANNYSASDNDHRFADLTWNWSYWFDIANQMTEANLTLRIRGHYVITGSRDHNNWIQLASVNEPVSERTIHVDISQILRNNPSNTVFIKFHDGSPTSGYGPSLWHVTLNTSTPLPGDNILTNGDFSNSDNGWWLFIDPSATAGGSVQNGEYVVSITNSSNVNWHIQLLQSNLLIENSKTYSLSFDGYAASPRQIGFYIRKASAPYTAYSGYQTFGLTSSKQNYSFNFTMNDPTDSNADLSFVLGASNVDVYFDNISLTEVTSTRFWADIDNDGDVDILDIQLVAAHWNTRVGDPNYDPRYDVDNEGQGDGDIDILDIQLVASWWNKL